MNPFDAQRKSISGPMAEPEPPPASVLTHLEYLLSHEGIDQLLVLHGMASRLETEAGGMDVRELRDSLRVVGETVSFLWEKTEAAAVLVSLYAERPPLQLVEVDDLLEEVADRERWIEPTGDWGVELVGPFPCVRGRRDWLKYIFAAFVRNARRHGGAHLRVDCVPGRKAGWWEMRFTDDGDGMEEEKRLGLFLPLSALEERRMEGAGTDLILVRAVAEAMQATPAHRRKEGRTVFSLFLQGEGGE